MNIAVRPAEEADVPEMSRVLIASITELCVADHGGDAAVIAAWTANKSESGVRQMMDGGSLYVAERDGRVVGVGAVGIDEITLNYVDPAHRRSGVGRAMMHSLEAVLAARGVTVARLKSTATARDFYRSQGWRDGEPVPGGRFIAACPMVKSLL